MTAELYTGAIDWDRIYRIFHSPSKIAKRIQEELDGANKHVLYSGFLETASYLASKMPVTFVDNSPSITMKAKKQYPELQAIQTGDVTQLIEQVPAPNVVIACRISAYWDSADYFGQLYNSIMAHPREQILVDFFDRDSVKPGQRITFETESDFGEWTFLTFDEQQKTKPAFCRTKLKVSYSLCDHNFSYEGYRSFFRKEALFNWFNSKLTNYEVTLGDALVVQDPSFSLKLVRKK